MYHVYARTTEFTALSSANEVGGCGNKFHIMTIGKHVTICGVVHLATSNLLM